MVFFITSCEPISKIYITNKSSDTLLLKFSPKQESLIKDPKNKTIQRDSSGINSDGYRKIFPHEEFLIWAIMGDYPTESTLPLKYIEISNKKDTVKIDSKEKMVFYLRSECR